MKFSIKVFFSQCDKIRIFLGIWSHLLKKYLMKNFIFCAVIKQEAMIHINDFDEMWKRVDLFSSIIILYFKKIIF